MPKENAPDKPERLRLEQVIEKEARYLETRRRLANQVPDGAATPTAGGTAGTATGAPPIAPSRRPIGLAFSGGGIRSATFNLGVLQALSQHRILPHVDYLSTVSGGGYIGSCFSSLLSRRQPPPRRHDDPPAKGEPLAPYLIGASPDTAAAFGTRPADFPFNTTPGQRPDRAGLDGRRQVRHLRTHGDFIIARKMVLSRDMLRAVGSVLGGLFYHLLIFVLFMLAASGAYFTLVCLMVGDLRSTIEPFTFGGYLRALVDAAGVDWGPAHPLVAGLLVGFVMTLLSIAATRAVLRRLRDDLFEVEGLSVDDRRDALALWIQGIVTLLTASIATGWFVHRAFGQGGLRPVLLTVPLAVYVGGQAAALVLHAVVATLDRFTRNDRSRFAAIKGILNYLSAASLLVVLLPYFVYAIAAYDGGLTLSGGWLLSAIGSAFLVRGGAGGKANPAAGAGAFVKRLLGASAAIRNALLAALVVVLLVGGVVLVSGLLVKAADLSGTTLLAAALALAGGAGALFLLAGYLLDFNDLSLHYFYRDRLAEAYLQTFAPLAEPPDRTPEVELRDDAEMLLTHLHGHPAAAGRGADEECVTVAPLHLLVTSLNLTSSRDMTRRDRKSDQFVFSKLHCGSQTTGFMATSAYRGGRTKLARAMTISGAAASPAMGRGTQFAEAFAMTLFNARLGQWMENPRYREGRMTRRNETMVFWPAFLVREVIGSTDANSRLIHLSDGGHTGDNLGIVPLLKRRCALIVACDAEADPNYTFGSLTEALRQVYIDDDIKVDLALDAIEPDPATGLSSSHCAVGRIRYPARPAAGDRPALPGEVGWLVVLKSSLTGDELARVANYKRDNPLFPQQSTADQFFDDAQFESYRELGYHVAKASLADVPRIAWHPEAAGWDEYWSLQQ